MNEFLRLVSRSLKPFGYQVRKHLSPNYLKIPALETFDNTQNIKALRHAANVPIFQTGSDLDKFVIFLRTCVRQNRNIDTRPRVTGSDMAENMTRCVRSLVHSVNHACDHIKDADIEVIILDDRSDDEIQAKIKALVSELKCLWSFHQTAETGQGNSLYEQFARAKEMNAIAYFCEDDYLHEEEAILTAWNFYKDMAERLESHLMIYPQEHRVMYVDHYPSYLIAGPDRHWRTMQNATHTFITHSWIVRDYWQHFENTKFVGVKKQRKKGSEAKTTNRLFKHIPGFSPLKPLAVHLQFEDTLPPLYDWTPLWKSMAE